MPRERCFLTSGESWLLASTSFFSAALRVAIAFTFTPAFCCAGALDAKSSATPPKINTLRKIDTLRKRPITFIASSLGGESSWWDHPRALAEEVSTGKSRCAFRRREQEESSRWL